MAEHAGWARVAPSWILNRFQKAGFTGEGNPNEWSSTLDLHRLFNPAKQGLCP